MNSTTTLGVIAEILHNPAPADSERRISRLLTDSRSLLTPDDTLFFALATSSGDGHHYIGELYEKGVRAFVVTKLPVSPMPGADFLVVEDVFEALRMVAAAYRNKWHGKVVAVTGSRGKTIVKEWAAGLFAACSKSVSRSPRSYNSRVGVPLSIWEADGDADYIFLEAGISREGEMKSLADLIRPDIVVFTSLTSEHDHGFGTRSDKLAEKALLASEAKAVVYPSDLPGVAEAFRDVPERFGWSLTDGSAFVKVETVDAFGARTGVKFLCRQQWGDTVLPFASRPLVDDALTLLTLALSQGLDPDRVSELLAGLRRVDTRLQVIEASGESLLVTDRFDTTLSALDQAVDFAARRRSPGCPLTVITPPIPGMSDILRLRGVDELICIGRLPGGEKFDCRVTECTDIDHFLTGYTSASLPRRMIVLMASSSPELERIAATLEAKRHETVLEINLDAVVDNLNFFRSLLKPTTGVCCMIKASGYGAGSVELARTLQSHGASYLAVAVHDEGAELRRAGITMPVIVLNPQVDDLRSIFANRLEPEIYSLEFLRHLIAAGEREGVTGFPVHIKIDSGMHRLGFLLETLPEVIELLKSTDVVTPRSIFTHLACADDPSEDDYTRGQFDYFSRCCKMLTEAFPARKILRHILNSTGIVRFPQEQLDMVRLGIGLYGLRTLNDGSMDALRPVSALYASIISLKSWPAGTTIGYNRRGVLERDSLIATVPIGYADGLNRGLSRGAARMIVRGVGCPIVGNICMDACMIDVTDVQGVSVGDRVEIFGPAMPVDTLAETLGTISYEIIAGVSPRVKRVYFRE